MAQCETDQSAVTHQLARKFTTKKGCARVRNRIGGGHPVIARPNKQQGAFIRALLLDAPRTAQDKLNALFHELSPYEKQLALVYAWRFEMWQIVESDDEKAANEARVALQMLFLNDVRQLLRLALARKESKTKQWAGIMLANIGASIGKYDKRLATANAAYVSEKNKMLKEKQLAQVLFPKPIMGTVRRELRNAERYRNALLLLKAGCGEAWKELARRQRIPKAYWPLAELPEFSAESQPQWWKVVWPLIRKHNRNLLLALRDGKIPTRGIRYHARWASYRKEFRNALRTLARLRSGEVL